MLVLFGMSLMTIVSYESLFEIVMRMKLEVVLIEVLWKLGVSFRKMFTMLFVIPNV